MQKNSYVSKLKKRKLARWYMVNNQMVNKCDL